MAIMHVGSARLRADGVAALRRRRRRCRPACEGGFAFFFYISPQTRISDGRRRKARLMNIQEQRSTELAQDEKERKTEWSARKKAGKGETRGGEIENEREKMP